MEEKLQNKLNEEISSLEILKEEREKIGNPDNLGKVIQDVILEQVNNQIAVIAGTDFIKENNGLTLDLRDDAHIQTTENFAEGKIATHNRTINYQERYNKWQDKLEHNEDGSVKTHSTRTGKQEATLKKGVRDIFDKDRPVGSKENGTDMDHIISTGEIIRNPAANAHLTEEEQIAFANSDVNLHEMDSSLNRSKGDKSMEDWLNHPNSKGQFPRDIFDNLTSEKEKELLEKGKKATEKYEKTKEEGEKISIETGKQSQKEEAFLIGGKALRAVILNLLTSLVKEIIAKLIQWFKSAKKNIETLIDSIKEAIKSFVGKIKQHLINAADTFFTTIASAIYGPIVMLFKKAWTLIKQAGKSLLDAIKYIKDPQNKGKSIGILMLEVGKILTAGATAAGAIVLGEAIEKALMTFPVFAFEIPLLGSLASIFGIFFGAIISGILGAIAINKLDSILKDKMKSENIHKQIDKGNEALVIQNQLNEVIDQKLESDKINMATTIKNRHEEAGNITREALTRIAENCAESDATKKASDNISVLIARLGK